jgi:hypothetical protein
LLHAEYKSRGSRKKARPDNMTRKLLLVLGRENWSRKDLRKIEEEAW